jgi:hypothetical protein
MSDWGQVVNHRDLANGADNRGAMLLMPSTRSAYPQVVSLRFAYFRVVRFRVSAAAQRDF